MLHKSPEVFADVILRAASALHVSGNMLEKEYYASSLLGRINKEMPEIFFRGGAAQRMCYHLSDLYGDRLEIGVFKEDDAASAAKQKKKLDQTVKKAAKDMGMELLEVTEGTGVTGMGHKLYHLRYPSVVDTSILPARLTVATAVYEGVYPTERRMVGNGIYTYLKQYDMLELVEEESIRPFAMQAESPERTMVDLVFDLCDAFLNEGTEGQHLSPSLLLYRIHRLSKEYMPDDSYGMLVKMVLLERRKSGKSPITAADRPTEEILKKILQTRYAKGDFESRGCRMIPEDVTYEAMRGSLKKILQAGIF